MDVDFEMAHIYAQRAIMCYEKGNIGAAADYWNRIYDLELPSEELFKIMNKFTDGQVFAITDYVKSREYY